VQRAGGRLHDHITEQNAVPERRCRAVSRTQIDASAAGEPSSTRFQNAFPILARPLRPVRGRSGWTPETLFPAASRDFISMNAAESACPSAASVSGVYCGSLSSDRRAAAASGADDGRA
jgi:hypothetical protein